MIPKYSSNAQQPTINKISHFEALQAIIKADSLIKKPFKKENINGLIDWVKSNQCYKLEYKNLIDAINIIKNLVSSI
jgi:hypothetical protein